MGRVSATPAFANRPGLVGQSRRVLVLSKGSRTEFGYGSEHVLTAAAKAIITAFTNGSLRSSTSTASANGSRQAPVLAQRFPADFDGIL